jgi:hypothetical protein
LQPVALTGFNDVTDVKFTERFSGSGDPTSVEFDNIVVGSATASASPPAPASLLAPVTLDDASMVNAEDLPLISTNNNVFTKSAVSDYGAIAADGFTITNLDRTDFAFYSYDSNVASIDGYFYDGPDVLADPFGRSAPSRIEFQRQDGGAFGVVSIDLDTLFPVTAVQSATFTGTTATGETVVQTFVLDNVAGMQTFQFSAGFNDLTSLQFAGNSNLQFDDITCRLSLRLNDKQQCLRPYHCRSANAFPWSRGAACLRTFWCRTMGSRTRSTRRRNSMPWKICPWRS